MPPKVVPETPGLTLTDPNRLGDYWEYYVALQAWERGAEVYKNFGKTGKTDLVLSHNGNLLEVDVKCLVQNRPGEYGTCNAISNAVKQVVVVHPITRKVRWIRGKEPKGWENFWD